MTKVDSSELWTYAWLSMCNCNVNIGTTVVIYLRVCWYELMQVISGLVGICYLFES